MGLLPEIEADAVTGSQEGDLALGEVALLEEELHEPDLLPLLGKIALANDALVRLRNREQLVPGGPLDHEVLLLIRHQRQT